jgi:hypothetical protein
MSAAAKEGNRLLVAFIYSLTISLLAFVCIVFLQSWRPMAYLIIIVFAYLFSCFASIIYQNSVCGFANVKGIFLSNLLVLRNIVLTCLVLIADSLPFFEKFTKPTSDATAPSGDISTKRGVEILSGIVKAILPEQMDEPVKEGFVYVYWVFWMTLLPFYFLIGMQGICTSQKKEMEKADE